MKKIIMTAAGLILGVSICSAENLLSWNFDGKNAASTAQTSDANHARVNSATLSDGGGFYHLNPNATQGDNDWSFFRAVDYSDTASALANGDYLTFTLTPTDGSLLSVTSIVFGAHARERNQTFYFTLYSSADNYASPLGSTVSFTSSGTGYEAYNLEINGFDLEVSEPVVFRLAVARAGAANLYAPFAIANIDQAAGVNGFAVRGEAGSTAPKGTTVIIR